MADTISMTAEGAHLASTGEDCRLSAVGGERPRLVLGGGDYSQAPRGFLRPGVPEHVEPEILGIHRDHNANTVANPMETTMTWTNRITIAATLIGGAFALMAYAQALSLPSHFV